MIQEKKEGPEFKEIPSQKQHVCGDCKYHKKQRWVCGHDHVTDNYSCNHPNFNTALQYGIIGEGRSIVFNSSETPPTPSWCPFLNSKG